MKRLFLLESAFNLAQRFPKFKIPRDREHAARLPSRRRKNMLIATVTGSAREPDFGVLCWSTQGVASFMNVPDGLLLPDWLWFGHGLYGLLLLAAVLRAPWKKLLDSSQLHVYLGTCVGLMVLWMIKAGITPGLNFHILGATLLTLMFGWPLAIVAGGVVLMAVTIDGMSGWQAFSVNALLMTGLPVGVTWGVYRLVERLLPRNLFLYIFLCGFFGAVLAMAATGIVSTALFAASGAYSLDHLLNQYLPFYLLMVFPEAVITGSLISMLVVYRPHWVATYDEDAYLR